MKPRAYLETTIVSYLTSRPSRDLVVAAHQQITQEWWERQRERFDVFVAPPVMEEAMSGDPGAAQRRIEALMDIPVLAVNEEAAELAQALIYHGPLPRSAIVDALHIAIAAVNGMDYLITWNCTHIANASMRSNIVSVQAGLEAALPRGLVWRGRLTSPSKPPPSYFRALTLPPEQLRNIEDVCRSRGYEPLVICTPE